MAPIVGRLTAADAPDVAALFARSRAMTMPWLPVLHSPDEDRAFFAGQLDEGAGWGAWESAGPERRLLGFAIIRPGWLDHLYVEPERRRQGVGSLLLGAALADRSGPVSLWVFQRNAAARAFYARHGFVEVERTDGSGNEEREPDIRLIRP